MNAQAPAPDYRTFLEQKIKLAAFDGFDVGPLEVHPWLKPHVKLIVPWLLKGGRRALFANFGLAKTSTQLECMRLVKRRHPNAHTLIVLPLGVRQEFKRDAASMGVSVKFIRGADEIDPDVDVHLTNYETVRDGKLSPAHFIAASLDEASVLRSYGSKTFQEFLPLFAGVTYRFVATATPSPNRYKELIHYAGFLGVMDTGESLTRFFQRDSEKANNLTLYPHKEEEFWLWVHSWALFVQKPSDLGCSDDGYDLPPLTVKWHEVPTNHALAGAERDGQGLLFRNAAIGVTQAAAEKRDSLGTRVAELMTIVGEQPNDDQLVIWCDLNDEQEAIEASLDEEGVSVTSLYGDQSIEQREEMLAEWRDRQTSALVTKPVMYGAGVNLQQAHTMIFAGIGFKFEDFIQAIHRCQRFGQTQEVTAHIIYSEAEREVRRNLEDKWARDVEMRARMAEIVKRYGLNVIPNEHLARSIGVKRRESAGETFKIVNADCIEETQAMEADSVDLIVTSIPFSNHYEYTPLYNDLGHTDDNDHFWRQMDYLTPELKRVLKPGRIAAIHVKDRILFGNVTGAGLPTVSPFHAETIFHYRRHGFDYVGLITVVTDVVRENNQTYRLGWTEQCKDATKMGVGCPEYVVLMHKPQSDRSRSYADQPVTKSKEEYSRARWQIDAHAFWRSSGERLLTADELAGYGPDKLARIFPVETLKRVYDYREHVQIGEALESRGALPATFMAIAPGSWSGQVWHDVNRMRTLNTAQSLEGRELHVCPLQLDIVERLINRFSNKGETVFDPFGGIGSVAYTAIKMRRRGVAVELHEGYWRDAVRYCEAAEREASIPTLFAMEAA